MQLTADSFRLFRDQLQLATITCSERGLVHSSKWAAEILDGIHKDLIDDQAPFTKNDTHVTAYDSLLPTLAGLEYNKYQYAKILFQARDYSTVVNVLKQFNHPKSYFLRLYSQYLVGERGKEEYMQVVLGTTAKVKAGNPELDSIYRELHSSYIEKKLDAFGLYLYGVVLRKRDEIQRATDILMESIYQYQYNWSAWVELALTVNSRYEFEQIQLRLNKEFQTSIMKNFFVAKLCVDLQYKANVFKAAIDPLGDYFPDSSYILSQWAIFYHDAMDFNESLLLFEELRELHPSRLEHMDVFSNVLYLLNMKSKLCLLASECEKIDKYRPETCCVQGNYYVLNGQPIESIDYFKKAIKMNKNYHLAWILLGHSYIEIHDTRAAIECYRRASEINHKDYKAWYGLGQAYVILQYPNSAIYYYQRAADLRPEDGRLWKALAECYTLMREEKLAENYYRRAESCEQKRFESEAIQIARIFERKGKLRTAIDFYRKVWEKAVKDDMVDDRIIDIALLLARHTLSLKRNTEAQLYASSVMKRNPYHEEAKDILKKASL